MERDAKALQLARVLLEQNEPGYRDYVPRLGFRQSDNIDDRRGDSFLQNWGGALMASARQMMPSGELLRASVTHPLTNVYETLANQTPFPEPTPLGIELGALDIMKKTNRQGDPR